MRDPACGYTLVDDNNEEYPCDAPDNCDHSRDDHTRYPVNAFNTGRQPHIDSCHATLEQLLYAPGANTCQCPSYRERA